MTITVNCITVKPSSKTRWQLHSVDLTSCRQCQTNKCMSNVCLTCLSANADQLHTIVCRYSCVISGVSTTHPLPRLHWNTSHGENITYQLKVLQTAASGGGGVVVVNKSTTSQYICTNKVVYRAQVCGGEVNPVVVSNPNHLTQRWPHTVILSAVYYIHTNIWQISSQSYHLVHYMVLLCVCVCVYVCLGHHSRIWLLVKSVSPTLVVSAAVDSFDIKDLSLVN